VKPLLILYLILTPPLTNTLPFFSELFYGILCCQISKPHSVILRLNAGQCDSVRVLSVEIHCTPPPPAIVVLPNHSVSVMCPGPVLSMGRNIDTNIRPLFSLARGPAVLTSSRPLVASQSLMGHFMCWSGQ
jgi:hypothetical protein